MRTILQSLAILLVFAFASCGVKNEALTQKKIDAYLESFKTLRKEAPDLLKQSNTGTLNSNDKSYGGFEEIIKRNGLTGTEYVIINAKVGAIFSILNSTEFVNDMQKMKDDGMGQMDEGQKAMKDQLNDPNVPEETKNQLRKAMEEMNAAKGQITDEFEKNKKFSDIVMDKTKSLTNQFISPDDAALIKLNFEKIKETFTDGMIPTNFNVK